MWSLLGQIGAEPFEFRGCSINFSVLHVEIKQLFWTTSCMKDIKSHDPN